MRSIRFKHVIAVPVLAAVVFAVLAASWLRSNAQQEVPVSVAEEFVRHLRTREFSEALALTTKSSFVGSTAAELERISERQLCGAALHPVGTYPPQTNANRLRRRLLRSEVEMPEVHVEFEGGCLLRVTLRHPQGARWQVYSFASHAG